MPSDSDAATPGTQPVFTAITTHHQVLLRQLRVSAKSRIKSLDLTSLQLLIHRWYALLSWYYHDTADFWHIHILSRPTNGEERVTPSALREHRQTHQFLGLCCLCPLFAPNGQGVYVEAAMYLATSGPFAGEYVAQCATGECGYLGGSQLYSGLS